MIQPVRLVLLGLALLLAGVGPEANFPALGPLYRIAEPDLLAHIQARAAASPELWRQQRAAAKVAAADWVNNPPPVVGLRKATQASVRLFDPSVRLTDPVIDAQGRVLHLPGELINPLTKVDLQGRLVFIDLREATQVAFAVRLLSESAHTRVIAVAGSPTRFAKHYGQRIYFDQYGGLSRRFGIVEIPAVISQSGLALRVETVALP